MTDDAAKAGGQQAGRFKPGQSGNPHGTKSGSRHKATLILDAIGEQAGKEILESTITAAKRGNSRAAEILLNRLWPARKSRPVVLKIPAVTDAAGVTAAMAEIVAAMARGDLAPDEAQAVSAVLEGQRRAIETNDLAERIRALEART